MLNIEKDIPIKQTISQLSKFSRFSLIQKITPKFLNNFVEGSKSVAKEIKQLIEQKNSKGQRCVLGLATGSTPISVYKQLIRMHKQDGLSFKNVVTFNLDQYYPISHNDQQSYHYYMNYHLFSHIDIPKENINIPSGEVDKDKVTQFCQDYEKKIKQFGGIDLQILGIGRTGHIGFNQPPSPSHSITRLVYLHRLTRKDAAPAFKGFQNVPKCAITMGIDTIQRAKKIIIMAWSQSKANIVKQSIEGEKTVQNPATFLHDHPNAVFYLDKTAGQKLSRFTIPWTIKGDYEDPVVPRTKVWILRSVIWLALSVKKPILRLTNDDYEDNGLYPIVIDCAKGKVQDLNLFVYKSLSQKLTGWPLGDKPQLSASGQNFIAKKSPKSQKVLIFSPHPDDDVICMAGTMKRLISQGHEVYVAYMTAGSNAVHDYEAKKYLYFLRQFHQQQFWKVDKNEDNGKIYHNYNKIIDQAIKKIENKTENDRQDSETLLEIKRYIRSSEAKIALQSLGIPSKNAFCLNLPFYGYNNKKKNPIGENDYTKVKDILKIVEPTFIYAAGDLTDPNGTHRKCLEILLKIIDTEHQKAALDPLYHSIVPSADKIFFYRGAWEQWDISMVKYMVMMSPKDVQDKIDAILKHQSQKHDPIFPGDDTRQFWLRSKQRNRDTAEKINSLGFSDYQAIECFVDLNDLRNHDQI